MNNKDIYKIIVRFYDLQAFVKRVGQHKLNAADRAELKKVSEKKTAGVYACDLGIHTPLRFMVEHHKDLLYTPAALGKICTGRVRLHVLTLTPNCTLVVTLQQKVWTPIFGYTIVHAILSTCSTIRCILL
jgi:hypothetical protein